MDVVNYGGKSTCCNGKVVLVKGLKRRWKCLDCGQYCNTKIITTTKKDQKSDLWIADAYPTGPAWTGD